MPAVHVCGRNPLLSIDREEVIGRDCGIQRKKGNGGNDHLDFTGIHLTHPLRPNMVGKNVLESKLPDGRFLVKVLIEMAKTKGEGWIEYMYPKPEELAKPTPFKEKIFSKKLAYVYRIPGKEMFVSAGLFE